MSESELVEILDTMLPYPVYPLRCFVPKIGRVEISAEEKYKHNVIAVRGFEVVDFDGFFFAALVDVGEVASGFCFDEYRQMRQLGILGLDHRVDRNLHGLGFLSLLETPSDPKVSQPWSISKSEFLNLVADGILVISFLVKLRHTCPCRVRRTLELAQSEHLSSASLVPMMEATDYRNLDHVPR